MTSKDMADCPVCIAKAGENCYLQTSVYTHRLTGQVYFTDKNKWHRGRQLKIVKESCN